MKKLDWSKPEFADGRKVNFTAMTYKGDKLGTCKAKNIHEARERLQKRFAYGLITFTDVNKVKRVVSL